MYLLSNISIGMMGGDPYGGGNPAYDGNSAPQAPPAREFFSVDEINDFINVCD